MIERTPAVEAKNIQPEEAEAIEIVWKNRGGGEVIPESEALQILDEVRERRTAIEREALQRLRKATVETRRFPRRTQRFALLVALPIALLLVALVIWLGGGHF